MSCKQSDARGPRLLVRKCFRICTLVSNACHKVALSCPSSIMFTGIVEVTGSTFLLHLRTGNKFPAKLTQPAVTSLEKQDDTAAGGGGTSLTISDCAEILTDAHLGDSISINGTSAQTASTLQPSLHHPGPPVFPCVPYPALPSGVKSFR